MKKLFFLFLFFKIVLANAQIVSQVEFSQQGNSVVVEYVLVASQPQKVRLYFSQDGGKTFSKPLKKVSGDVGDGIVQGKKRIIWEVLEELPELEGANIAFMVEIADGLIWEAKNGRPRMEWVYIPAGTFTMGSPEYESGRDNDEGPQHSIILNEFKMSKYEVTFSQYKAFCKATGKQKPERHGQGRGKHPVINVDWYDATEFARWRGCRLPTEAEWEYACRAGTETPFNTGITLSMKQARINSIEVKRVGSYPPNSWGLYDMHGNVWEWCSDFHGSYPESTTYNPTGHSLGPNRVLRGGGWYDEQKTCRSAKRNNHGPSYRDVTVGFRIVVSD